MAPIVVSPASSSGVLAPLPPDTPTEKSACVRPPAPSAAGRRSSELPYRAVELLLGPRRSVSAVPRALYGAWANTVAFSASVKNSCDVNSSPDAPHLEVDVARRGRE